MEIYSYDKRFDDLPYLFFISEPESKHCKDIANQQWVACAITDSSQKVKDQKIGVQIQGVASEVSRVEKIKQILEMWNKLNPGIEDIINYENIKKKVISSKVYKVKPLLIKFFNEELYGPEGFEVFKF